LRGRRAFQRGEDDAALESFARLASHGLEYADVYYMTGILHERRDELEPALENLRSAVRINPSYVEALLALASLYERRGDFDQSQGYAERASQLAKPTAGSLDPTTRGKLANQQAALGDALAQAGEKRDAIEEYRRALDRCPTFHDIRHRLGMTLREAGLPFQAAQEFRRILRTHSGMLDSQIQLGLTYYSMGRTPEAIGEWEAVLEKDSSRDEARMYLRLVRGAGRIAPRPVTETTGNADLVDDDSNDDIEISGWSKSVLTTGPGETPT
jgi:tetratricopeptide (TPR) repeat protein